MNTDFWVVLSDRMGFFLIGAMGGLVRWITLREHWGDGLASIVVGAIMSGVFAEQFAPVLLGVTVTILKTIEVVTGPVVLTSDDFAGPAGFLIGIGGIAISGLIIDLWRAFRNKAGKGGSDGTAS